MGVRYCCVAETLYSMGSLQVIVNLLGSSLVGSKEGEATLSTAYQTHQKSSQVHLLEYWGSTFLMNFVFQHTDISHILWDCHALGGHKNIDNLDAKVNLKLIFWTSS